MRTAVLVSFVCAIAAGAGVSSRTFCYKNIGCGRKLTTTSVGHCMIFTNRTPRKNVDRKKLPESKSDESSIIRKYFLKGQHVTSEIGHTTEAVMVNRISRNETDDLSVEVHTASTYRTRSRRTVDSHIRQLRRSGQRRDTLKLRSCASGEKSTDNGCQREHSIGMQHTTSTPILSTKPPSVPTQPTTEYRPATSPTRPPTFTPATHRPIFIPMNTRPSIFISKPTPPTKTVVTTYPPPITTTASRKGYNYEIPKIPFTLPTNIVPKQTPFLSPKPVAEDKTQNRASRERPTFNMRLPELI
ncbi:hypothetical protein EVAR_54197_1 [Eumeta japonica]|uniref:Uncharacterized protein n=1 Tax=Eumeta variegata TaxID=151549 RepID=A0A4C1YD02_EUMVA|nr:hypothetical protein EVAR_54197_1 [Eumeta japonica]